jgi:SAM-dependent methyltransferase
MMGVVSYLGYPVAYVETLAQSRSVTTYTHGHADAVLRAHRWRTAENSAGYLLPHLRAGLSLLDVGCGPGSLTVDLARRVAPGRVVAIDSAVAPLDEARAAATDAGVQVDVRVGDAYAIDLPDDSVDVVHAHQLLQHVADPVAVLREMARVCRPGGLVAARDSDYAAMTWAPADPRLDRWLAIYRGTARANGAEPDAGRRLLGWAHAAGLSDVTALPARGASRTPRTVDGGAGCGPTARQAARTGSRRSPQG